jgi:hypothetical protein
MLDLSTVVHLAKTFSELDEYDHAAIEGLIAGHDACDFDEDTLEAARIWLHTVGVHAEEAENDLLVREADMIMGRANGEPM